MSPTSPTISTIQKQEGCKFVRGEQLLVTGTGQDWLHEALGGNHAATVW